MKIECKSFSMRFPLNGSCEWIRFALGPTIRGIILPDDDRALPRWHYKEMKEGERYRDARRDGVRWLNSSFCRAASGPCRSRDLRVSHTIVRAGTKSSGPAPLMIVMGTLRYTVRDEGAVARWGSLARSSREWNKVIAILIVVSWASRDIAASIARERIAPNAPRLPFHR